ncbi:MAG: CHAT domain-containing protein [Acidobacteriota bacterium]
MPRAGAAQALSTTQQAPPQLEAGRAIERPISGGEKHAYRIAVAAGQFLQIVVDQRGIDLALALLAPDEKELLVVDSPTGANGPESFSYFAEQPGELRVEVRGGDDRSARGRYELRLTTLRAATPDDRTRASAEMMMREADALLGERDPAKRRQGIEKAQAALVLWQGLRDEAGQGSALFASGDGYRLLNEREKAVAAYQQALPHWRAAGDDQHEAATLHALGLIANAMNQKTEALGYFNQALTLRRTAKDREGEANTLNAIGLISSDLGDRRNALDYFQQSLRLRRAAGDRTGEATVLNSIGVAYRDLGEKRKALDYYNQSLVLRRATRDRDGEATTLTNIGVAYSELGDQQRALDAYSAALPLRRTPATRAVTLNNIGRAYDLLGLSQEAIKHYDQALDAYRGAGDKRGEAQTLNYKGLAYWALGDYEQSQTALNQALPLRREVKDKVGTAATLNNLGLVYDGIGDRRKARESYDEALRLFRESGDPQGEAYALNNLGFVAEALGETVAALEYHQRALELSRKVGDRMREAKTRYGIARIERGRGRLRQARSQAEQTIRIVESLRLNLTNPELRAAYRASVQRYYDLYIDVLMRLDRRQPGQGFTGLALQAGERARARGLLELLAEAGAEIRQGVKPELVARERELQEQLNDKTIGQMRLISAKHTSEQAADAAAEIGTLTAEYRTLQDQIRRESPRYAALTQPQSLSPIEIQKKVLDPRTLLLEYALGEERSYLWAVSTTSVRAYTLPKRSTIEDLARQYYAALTARNEFPANETGSARIARLSAADAESEALGAQLSQMLLGPAAAQLGRQRLLIVTDGALAYVPFVALPQPGRPQAGPLISAHEVVSLPSATTLAVLRKEATDRTPASRVVAVFADPVFDSSDDRIRVVQITAEPARDKAAGTGPAAKASSDDVSRILVTKSAKDTKTTDARLKIPRLPYTRREGEAILALAPVDSTSSAFDFAANRTLVMGDELSKYRIIHFATHGFLNSLNPELSGLVLSLYDEKGASQNGLVLVPDIFNLKLDAAELVVLSACQTGLGKEVRGEGLVGLTRGFMYAGAPRVVVSLWNVSDRATSELMQRFYQGMLEKKLSPSAALRTAQVELRKNNVWKAPYYWAAFGLQGEVR